MCQAQRPDWNCRLSCRETFCVLLSSRVSHSKSCLFMGAFGSVVPPFSFKKNRKKRNPPEWQLESAMSLMSRRHGYPCIAKGIDKIFAAKQSIVMRELPDAWPPCSVPYTERNSVDLVSPSAYVKPYWINMSDPEPVLFEHSARLL